MNMTPEELETQNGLTRKADDYSTAESKPQVNEHACRLHDPSKYAKFARKNGEQEHGGKKIDVIYGITKAGKSEIQALRYPKGSWDAGAARSHCGSRGGSFTAAGGGEDEKFMMMPSLEEKMLSVHTPAVQYAETLIDDGKVNAKDRLKLTEADRQAMLGRKGDDWENYAQHHLGVDNNMPYQTRMRHTHPIIKDGQCYLREVKRAAMDDNHEVAKCAKGLCKRAGVEMPGDDTGMEEKD